MSQPIRVLFADSSAVVRKILQQLLNEHPETEVAFAAKDGTEAIREFSRMRPDVVVLDVEMPGINGLEAAKAIHAIEPATPIIMFSTLTTKYATTTMNALSNGACDYETKPPMAGHLWQVQQSLLETLVPKIISWGKRRRHSNLRQQADAEQNPSNTMNLLEWTPAVLAVGASTGGPDALSTYLSSFPEDFHLPIVIVQHMPPVFTRILAERLNAGSNLEVLEAEHEMPLKPGRVILAPGDYHMQVQRKGEDVVVALDQDEMVNFCRPSVDKLFHSVKDTFGRHCLTVMLTGMGKDGFVGCQLIHADGGVILAQDKESSVVWGMPGCVVNAGLASYVGPPESIARETLRFLSSNCQTVTS